MQKNSHTEKDIKGKWFQFKSRITEIFYYLKNGKQVIGKEETALYCFEVGIILIEENQSVQIHWNANLLIEAIADGLQRIY